MPNAKGGKNYKKNKQGAGKMKGKKTKTPYADSPELLYAQVKNKIGGDRLSIECSDGVERRGIIPGSFYKRVWINKNDILLIQMNELNTKEGYILYKYDQNEARSLKNKGLLKFDLGNIQEDDVIQFGYDFANNSDKSDNDEDDIQAEVDKKMKEQQTKKVIEVNYILDDNLDDNTTDTKEPTPLDRKNKVKTDNLKRQTNRNNKYVKDDGTIDIDAI